MLLFEALILLNKLDLYFELLCLVKKGNFLDESFLIEKLQLCSIDQMRYIYLNFLHNSGTNVWCT